MTAPVPPSPPPRHVAVIMDGNGRWARARGLPRSAGHKRGADAVRRLLEGARDLGIDYVTLFSFSSENWRRPEEEVGYLMRLMRVYLDGELDKLHKKGVRLRFIGDRDRLDADFVALMERAETLTRENPGQNLIIAVDYGARREIVRAARRLAEEVGAGRLDPGAIDEALFASRLDTADIPDPDLILRTSGESRISNFLLWQAAYAELVFIDTLWPDFTKRDLEAAIDEYHRRERRFGATGAA